MATVASAVRASGFARSQVRLWHLATLQPLGQPLRLDSLVAGADVRFSPGGRFLLAGTDSDACLCDVAAPAPAFHKVRGHDGTAAKAAFSPDGQLLAITSASADGVRLLDTASRAPVSYLDCGGPVTRIAFPPAGRFLATIVSGKRQSAIDLWIAGQPAIRRRLEGFPFPVTSLRFSPDGQFIAAASNVHRQHATQHALTGTPIRRSRAANSTFPARSRSRSRRTAASRRQLRRPDDPPVGHARARTPCCSSALPAATALAQRRTGAGWHSHRTRGCWPPPTTTAPAYGPCRTRPELRRSYSPAMNPTVNRTAPPSSPG
jgi:hypothetical protein